jgi:hypothetical protein
MYRHFIELIIRIAYLKNNSSVPNLHRIVERLIENDFAKLNSDDLNKVIKILFRWTNMIHQKNHRIRIL